MAYNALRKHFATELAFWYKVACLPTITRSSGGLNRKLGQTVRCGRTVNQGL